MGTTGILGNRQRRIIPTEPMYAYGWIGWISGLLQMAPETNPDEDRFPLLRQTAASVLAEADIDPKNVLAAAEALNRYLGTSGQYFYSLEPQQRDPRSTRSRISWPCTRRGIASTSPAPWR